MIKIAGGIFVKEAINKAQIAGLSTFSRGRLGRLMNSSDQMSRIQAGINSAATAPIASDIQSQKSFGQPLRHIREMLLPREDKMLSRHVKLVRQIAEHKANREAAEFRRGFEARG
jgi:hypothetical protein